MYCDKCGVRFIIYTIDVVIVIQTVPVPETDLPVLLPHNVPVTGRGLSPLLEQHDWIKASCGKYVLHRVWYI